MWGWEIARILTEVESGHREGEIRLHGGEKADRMPHNATRAGPWLLIALMSTGPWLAFPSPELGLDPDMGSVCSVLSPCQRMAQHSG